MNKKILFFLIGSGVFLLFIFFSYLVARDIFIKFDFDTTVKLQDNISRRFDEPFSWISEIGKFEPSLIFLLIITTILLLRKKFLGIFGIFFFGLLHVLELYGKFFVEHLPPPEFLLRTKKLIEFPQFHVRLENSYPSGHAGRAAFLSILVGIIILRSKKLSKNQKYLILGFLVVYDLTMFMSRVYLGEHWISDVIGGALLGLSLGLLAALAL